MKTRSKVSGGSEPLKKAVGGGEAFGSPDTKKLKFFYMQGTRKPTRN